MKNKYKILAIDPSVRCTGLYYDDPFEGPIGRVIERMPAEKASGDAQDSRYAILRKIHDRIKHICRHNFFDIALIEQYAYGAKGSAVTKLAEAGAVVRLAVYSKGIPIVEIAPNTWKKLVVLNGHASKEYVRSFVEKEYGKKFEKQDLYDAFCIYIAACLTLGSTVVGDETQENLYNKMMEAMNC